METLIHFLSEILVEIQTKYHPNQMKQLCPFASIKKIEIFIQSQSTYKKCPSHLLIQNHLVLDCNSFQFHYLYPFQLILSTQHIQQKHNNRHNEQSNILAANHL